MTIKLKKITRIENKYPMNPPFKFIYYHRNQEGTIKYETKIKVVRELYNNPVGFRTFQAEDGSTWTEDYLIRKFIEKDYIYEWE
jgi:hypothetical protein